MNNITQQHFPSGQYFYLILSPYAYIVIISKDYYLTKSSHSNKSHSKFANPSPYNSFYYTAIRPFINVLL